MDYSIIVTVGLFITGIGTFFILSSAKYFTIREQAIYDEWIRRELDVIHKRLELLESTRPTTGELRAVITGRLEKN